MNHRDRPIELQARIIWKTAHIYYTGQAHAIPPSISPDNEMRWGKALFPLTRAIFEKKLFFEYGASLKVKF
jgi:hypothetical protein